MIIECRWKKHDSRIVLFVISTECYRWCHECNVTERTGTGVYYLILSGFGKKRRYKSVKTRTRVFFCVCSLPHPADSVSGFAALWWPSWFESPFQMPLRDAKNTRTGDSNAVSRTAESWTRPWRSAPGVFGIPPQDSQREAWSIVANDGVLILMSVESKLTDANPAGMSSAGTDAALEGREDSRWWRAIPTDRQTGSTLSSTRAQGYRILQGSCINAFCLKHSIPASWLWWHMQSDPEEHCFHVNKGQLEAWPPRDLRMTSEIELCNRGSSLIYLWIPFNINKTMQHFISQTSLQLKGSTSKYIPD